MREILFRAKRADNGEWVEGAFSFHSWNYFGEREEKPQIIIFSENEDFDGLWCEVLPETVGQYTGLTDKNGKKIFEGDIVKAHYANAKKSDFVETVVFHNGKFCAFHSNNGCKQWTMLYDGVKHLSIDKSVYMDSVEIIGNIHDNPELLESGEENETPH